MIKSKSLLFILALCVSIILVSCDQRDDRSAADLTIPVSVIKVKRQQIASSISATGTLKAQYEQNLLTEVEGLLNIPASALKKYEDAQPVKAGELIATLKNPEYELITRVESKKMAMDDAEHEVAKQQALFQEGGVTEKELNLAKRTALDARLNYETAVLNNQKLQLRAPEDGYIAGLQSNYMNTIVKMGFKVCSIADYSSCVVDVNLPNSDLGRIAVGARVEITNYALEDETFDGHVIAIDPTVNPQTRTFSVRITVENEKLQLRPGMFIKADIIIEEKEDAVVIPKSAMSTHGNQKHVFVVNGVEAGELDIATGIETRDLIEVTDGLSEGERLIVKGHETLRDKSKVRVIE
ncbi:MAG: efflux RND transporter periplasmic adaptor subunit [Deferribacteres bacterium]|nr:efflux RND transporter periplasmic adaptor subunit [candidate division KSB1 bacterium]MCB9502896.1 efflux RND transporter periplasmic adaptor subunit [Deferribacteres bacterium]